MCLGGLHTATKQKRESAVSKFTSASSMLSIMQQTHCMYVAKMQLSAGQGVTYHRSGAAAEKQDSPGTYLGHFGDHKLQRQNQCHMLQEW